MSEYSKNFVSYFRYIALSLFILLLLYAILTTTSLGNSIHIIIINYIEIIEESFFFNGIIDYIYNKDNSWNVLTTLTTTFIAIISLTFLYHRIRKQEKLIKETIASNASNRYRDAISLLNSDNDTVATGAIYLLDKLAREQPGKYAELVRDLLCSYLRNETVKRGSDEKFLPEKYQAALNCLFRKGKIFKDFVYSDIVPRIDLSYTNLSFADLSNADLSRAYFLKANLECVNFTKANLAIAVFQNTKLDGADFNKTFLMLTEFIETDLKNTKNLDKALRLDTIKFGDSTPEYINEIVKKNENDEVINKTIFKVRCYFQKHIDKYRKRKQ